MRPEPQPRPPAVVLKGGERGWIIQRHAPGVGPRLVQSPTLRIGAALDNEVVIDRAGVGLRHCTLRCEGPVVRVYDHGAGPTTLVDGAEVDAPRLIAGAARLLIGDEHLTVRPLAPPLDTSALRRGFVGQSPPAIRTGDAAASAEPGDAPAERSRSEPRRTRRRADASRPRRSSPPRFALTLGSLLGAAVIAYAVTSARAAEDRMSSRTHVRSTQGEARPPPPGTHRASPRGRNPRSTASRAPARTLDGATPAELRVGVGESWDSLAVTYDLDLALLRAANPGLRGALRAGDRVALPLVATPTTCGAGLEIPGGAASIGGVTRGALDDPLRLPELALYTLRCPRHAYATGATAKALVDAIACFRAAQGYTGEVVIGDISSANGGPLGPHRSHQSGRDVDIWLPTLAGAYARGCAHCGTEVCRPEPDEVDWEATWGLIDALAQQPAVEVIFLDYALHEQLRRAALRAGARPALLDARIQWPRRGAATLVQHAEGHVHHIHVRMRCPEGDAQCVERTAPRRD
ncbi:MAG: penicillin-insensitive murein endopeptidase [Myxococcales bacterium]|nr:penicillin-insensitive murein endopeptidase [Myxococcales bacterium]